ncbi:hypothetical protein B0H13DRAFT_385474 [Mycena leptocephala]|nr:hypothetical protein B0H13DRAFT_385474 [Mycena leptocephala]
MEEAGYDTSVPYADTARKGKVCRIDTSADNDEEDTKEEWELENLPTNPAHPSTPRRPTFPPRNSTFANNANVNRLAREPQVSNINEDEGPEDAQLTPPRKTKKKARLSASRLPLPARSSTPPFADRDRASCASEPGSTAEGEAGGRERRTRKSVNYAEPKLNTMRRPEPPAGSAPIPAPAKRSRSSAAAAIPVQSTRRPILAAQDHAIRGAGGGRRWGEGRRRG